MSRAGPASDRYWFGPPAPEVEYEQTSKVKKIVKKASEALPVDDLNREAQRSGRYQFGHNKPVEYMPSTDEGDVAKVLNKTPVLKGDAFLTHHMYGYRERSSDKTFRTDRKNAEWDVKAQKFNKLPAPKFWMFVLNLEHREDRAQSLINTFIEASGKEFLDDNQFISPAVEGKFITDKEFQESGFRNNMKELRKKKNAMGCYMAHFTTILTAYASGLFPAVIFEDDLAIAKGDTYDDLAKAVANIPAGTVLAYLGALPVKDRKRVDMPKEPTGWIPVPAGFQLYGGHAYVIPTAAAAEVMIDWLLTNKTTVDSAYVKFQKSHPAMVRVLNPFMFFQGESYSDIEEVKRGVRGAGRVLGQSVGDDIRNTPIGARLNHPDLVD